MSEPRYIEYTIVKAHDHEVVVEKVNGLLNNGWRIIGNLSIAASPNFVYYAQAMGKVAPMTRQPSLGPR